MCAPSRQPSRSCRPGSGAWQAQDLLLPHRWQLLLFTDGLVEGRTGPSGERLGTEGLERLLSASAERAYSPTADARLLDWLIGEVSALNGEALGDDVAVLLVAFPGADP